MTDSQTIDELVKYFDLSLAPKPYFWQWYGLLSEYRTLKSQGNTKVTIVNLWKKQGRDATMSAAFVNGMEQIERGNPIQDPNESPSWSEAYDMALGPIVNTVSTKLPWGKITLVGLAALFVVYGVPNMAGKMMREKRRAPGLRQSIGERIRRQK